uniref:Uncharacterized protein n=1 Tax=Romanomermis culicivorax TaxID=13658 RepID=A0A915LCF6_ROMCU
MKLLFAPAALSCTLAYTSAMWAVYLMVYYLPAYLRDVLHMDLYRRAIHIFWEQQNPKVKKLRRTGLRGTARRSMTSHHAASLVSMNRTAGAARYCAVPHGEV